MTDLATLAIQITTSGGNRATSDLRNVERASRQTERQVDALQTRLRALKGLIEAGLVSKGLTELINMADRMQSLRSQIQFVTGSMAELNHVQAELFEISQRTRASLEATTQLYVRSSRAMKDYGVTQKQVLQFTETINQAMAVGGVGAQEQASALMQLSQALGSGTLQGDEFRTIAETAPIILDVVAEYLGKSRAEVKKLASDGKITAQLLFDAINQSTQKINKQFERMPMTFGQAMQQMQNATLKFAGDLNQTLGITQHLAEGVGYLAQHFDTLAHIMGGLILAHLANYVTGLMTATIHTHKQHQANLQAASAAQARAASELQIARADMMVLQQELRLAQTEQTRQAIRAKMAQQASQIVSLTTAEAVATRNLASAQQTAALGARALKGAMGLLGGPAGVITLAASALFYFYQQAKEAREKALDLASANDRLKKSYDDLSQTQLTNAVREQIALVKNAQKQYRLLEREIQQQKRAMQLMIFPTKEMRAELDALNDKLKTSGETGRVELQVLEKQLLILAPLFLASGKSLDAFREKLILMGLDANTAANMVKRVETQLAQLPDQGNKKTENKTALATTGGNEQANHLAQWQSHLNALKQQHADAWNAIALKEAQAMRDMLEKAKKANASHQDIEHARWLIAQTYQQQRQALAENYAPSLKYERELNAQLKEIEQLQKANILTDKQAGDAKLALGAKYHPVLAAQQAYINHLKEIAQLEKHQILTPEQANRARENEKWEKSTALATQAGIDAVSPQARWREEFDPMQAIENEQTAKLAEIQSLYDQALIDYDNFLMAKAVIETDAAQKTQNLFMGSVSGFRGAMDTMMDVLKNAGQEQSGIYKTLFAMNKAFALADSIISIQNAIAKAANLPYPENLGAMATVAASTANIIATIQSTQLKGMAHSGIDHVPREGTWLLDQGERVVDSRTNADLKTFLRQQNKGQGANVANGTKVNVTIINKGTQAQANVESKQTSNGLEITVELFNQIKKIAKAEANDVVQQNFRNGGVFASAATGRAL